MSFLSLPAGAAARPLIVGIGAPTDLRVVLPSVLFRQGMEARTAAGVFVWDAASVAVDDGVSVIKPNDIAPANPGRWLIFPPVAVPEPYRFLLAGVFSGVPVPAFFDPPELVINPYAPRTLKRVSMVRRTAGTAGATSIQISRNGALVLAAPLSVTAAAGAYATATTIAFVPGEEVFGPANIIDCVLLTTETFFAGPNPGPEGLRVLLEF